MAILYCFLNSEVQEVIKRRLIQRFLTNRDISEGLELQHLNSKKRTEETKKVEANISVVQEIHLQPESMKIIVEEEVNVE